MNHLRTLTGRLLISGIAVGLIAAPNLVWPQEQRLQEQTERLHEASRADYAMAMRCMDVDGKWHEGVALLAQALHSWPENPQAAVLLYSTLSLHAPEQQYWPRLVLQGSEGVWDAHYSADGKRILTISEDGAQVWDAVTGEPAGGRIKEADSEAMAGFSQDGSRLVITHRSHRIEVLDVATEKRIGEAMVHEGVNSADFSPDGSRIVSISDDHSVQVWDAATQQPVGGHLTHEDLVGDAEFSRDGRFIVTASEDKTVRIWDAATGRPVTNPVRHEHAVERVEFSPVDLRILTTCDDGSSRVYDLSQGQFVGGPMRHREAVKEAHFSPDGTLVLTASNDCTAQVWDAATGQPQGGPLRHESEVQHAKFSADGRYVVTTDFDGVARVWETNASTEPRKPLGAPLRQEDGVHDAVFSPDGRHVLTAGSRGPALVWDAPTGMPQGEPLRLGGGGLYGGGMIRGPRRNESMVMDAVLSPDGTRMVVVSSRAPAQLWDLTTGRPTGRPLLGHTFWPGCNAEFSQDGRQVVTTSWKRVAGVWDAATGHAVCSLTGHNGFVMSAHFSPDGKRVLTASMDGTAQVWSVETGQSLFLPMRHQGNVLSAEFSRDGKRIITASADGTARVWDAAHGQTVPLLLKHDDASQVKVHSAHFSPDGARVVTACADGTAHLWDAVTGKRMGGMIAIPGLKPRTMRDEELLQKPWRQAAGVVTAEFSPDGTHIVTALSDGTSQAWDAVTGLPLGVPLGKPSRYDSILGCARYSPDGRLIVTTHNDGMARLWDAATGQPIGEPLDHGRSGRDAGKYGDTPKASFSADGTFIVTSGIDEVVRLCRLPPPTAKLVPVPQWMLTRAYAIAGMERAADGGLQPLKPELRRAAVLAAVPEDGGVWSRMARWLALPAQERTLTPESKFTRRQLAERERDSCYWNGAQYVFAHQSKEALESALRYDPTTPLAHLMLAGALTGGWSGGNPDPTAAMLHRHGLQFLPENAAPWSLAATMLLDQGNHSLALQAAEKALKLDPNNKEALEAKVSAEDWIKRSTLQR